jgi:hypothetical protein
MAATRTEGTGETLTVLSAGKATSVPAGPPGLPGAGGAWLPRAALPEATGWELKPEGVCRDEVCVPLSPALEGSLLREAGGEVWFDLTAFARHVGQPYVHEPRHRVWSLGPPPHEWERRGGTGPAPDVTLPDLAGRLHSLSDFRGTKVFLVTWASW